MPNSNTIGQKWLDWVGGMTPNEKLYILENNIIFLKNNMPSSDIDEKILALQSQVEDLSRSINNNATNINNLVLKMGDLDTLTTTDKTSLVNAINEVASGSSGGDSEIIGDFDKLKLINPPVWQDEDGVTISNILGWILSGNLTIDKIDAEVSGLVATLKIPSYAPSACALHIASKDLGGAYDTVINIGAGAWKQYFPMPDGTGNFMIEIEQTDSSTGTYTFTFSGNEKLTTLTQVQLNLH